MAVAEMNPGGYDTAHLLQGAYAAFVPKGATSSDKSWLRIFTNLAVRFDSIACTKVRNASCSCSCCALFWIQARG